MEQLREPREGTGLRGRATECAVLDELLGAIRAGESGSLVVRGEAGIGKTALLDYLVASASDVSVLRAVGVDSEMELPYSSLHQLCAPLLGRLPELPGPQRHALEIIFGRSAGAGPDRFLVGLAVLSLLSEVAHDRPLLCVVDDAQWLDRASALSLAFVARRLSVEPVGLVFAAREPSDDFRHVPELEVLGLSDRDARALLTSAVGFKLDEAVRDRIVAETGGNPLALLELPHGLTATQLAGGFGLLDAELVSGRIERSFVRRINELSGDARRLLLLAAAEPVGDPLLLLRASERLGIPVSAVGAQTDGLLALGERVMFRHPLARSAVYRSAAVPDRQAVHRALAESTDRHVDPDRRAWHLASAAAGPDERVAVELERSAARAEARGGVAASAAFLQRSVALTDDPARRAERALAAAQASLQAGAFDASLGLLAAAQAGTLDDFQRARVDLVRGHVAFNSGLGDDAPPLLLEAARQLEPFDLELARKTYLTAWVAAGMAANQAEREVLLEICRAAHALPPTPGGPRPLDLLLDGVAVLITDGHAAAVPTLRRAATELTSMPVEDVLRWGWMAATPSVVLWDYEGMHTICARHVQLARDAGALADLTFHLNQLGMAREWLGDLAGAEALVAEEASVAAATGSPIAPYTLMRLRALQGREAEASAAIASAIEHDTSEGQGIAGAYAHWAAAILYNGLAHYEEAVSAARQATAHTVYPFPSMYALPDLVEAAARAGDLELAHEALGRLAQTTQPCDNDVALGIEARCRALLSDGATAEALHREAIDRLSRTRVRPDLGRAHLLFGEWLRREGRRTDAREHLHAADRQFTSIGMAAFAERAQKELLATGEKARKRSVETRDELTSQERQIARMASDGLSNTEIGTRLLLSPRTVEWHLRKVFGKLGIHSRHQLAAALPCSDGGLVTDLSSRGVRAPD